jgi:RND family efflux transporter MFP subunit
MPSSYKNSLLIIPLMVVSAGCQQETKVAAPAVREEALLVEVATVQPSNMPRIISAIGTLRYRRETPLGFTASGKVSQVNFKAGDSVTRGALLAVLETSASSAAPVVTAGDTSNQKAQSEFEKIRALYADGWVTKKRYEAAEAAARIGRDRVRKAQPVTEQLRLYAPSSGVVLSRNVEFGQIVGAGTPALILGEDDQGFIFRVPIIDKDASALSVGMPAEILLESLDKAPFSATVSEIDSRANDATGAMIVQFRLRGRAGMRSGQIGKVNIAMSVSEDGILQIPATALFAMRAGEALIYVVDPVTNRIETRNVVIEQLADKLALVSGGLQPGDTIVVQGGEKLRTGVKVRFTKQLD